MNPVNLTKPSKTLQGFVGERAAKGATIYTDDHGGYQGMPFEHETVKHSISEYVNGMAHTNGIGLSGLYSSAATTGLSTT